MAKQTAVDWLKLQIKNCPNTENSMNNIDGFLKEALEMEKQQLIDFHIEVMKQGLIDEGSKRWSDDYLPKIKETAEQYYQETYKSEKDKGCACYGNNAVHKCNCK
jgi:hypothetical protein